MASRPVIVLGAGGHAKVVVDLLISLGRTVLAAVELTAPAQARSLLDIPVKGGDFVSENDPANVELALGIGMPSGQPIEGLAARRAEGARFEACGYSFPALVHGSAVVGADCSIGAGAQIMAGAVLQPSCVIEPFAIVNTRASVDHDCVVGDGSHIGPGTTLGGQVRVGRGTLVGIGATVLQGITIGDQAMIAGGAVVVENVGDFERRIGVPARRLL
jgi:sugar O-acyltransferase (sialic acid O-acetyltransferase NeuD family)